MFFYRVKISMNGIFKCGFLLLMFLLFVQVALADAPVVDSFTASKVSVATGETINLVLNAHDPDCLDSCTSGCGQAVSSSLTIWSATGGSFSSVDYGITGSPYTTWADWTAPETDGIYTVTVDIYDNATWLCGNRQSAQANISISVSSSPPPVIDSLSALPLKIDYLDSSVLTCNATDPSGYALTYSWSTDHGELTVSDSSSDSATFTASEEGNYIATITCTVDNGHGGVASDTVAVDCTYWSYLTTYNTMTGPTAIAVDSSGNVAVSNTLNGSVSVFSPSGVPVKTVYAVSKPAGIAFSVSGNLLVGDYKNGSVSILDGNFDFIGYLGKGAGEFLKPSDMAVHPVSGNVYVLDRDRNEVKVFDSTGSKLFQFGSLGSAVDRLNKPTGIAVSPLTYDIFISDRNNYRIQVFDDSGNYLRSFGVKGQNAGEFSSIAGIGFDDKGSLYIVDEYQGFVQMFSEDGIFITEISSFGNSKGNLNLPVDAVVDQANRLFVTSSNKGTVDVFQLGGSDSAPEPATDVVAVDLVGDNGGTIVVSWTKSSCEPYGVVSYEIFRKEGEGGSLISVGTVGTGVESYNDNTAEDGVYYYYMVRARSTNYFADSVLSNVVTSVNDLIPAVPTGLTLTQDVNGTVKATWNANSDSDIKGYYVSYDTLPGTHRNAVFAGNTTSYIFSELTLGTFYYISVMAEDSASNFSGYSTEETITPADRIAPAVPTGFRGADRGFDSTLYFAWNANAESDISGYTVYYGTSSGNYTGSVFTGMTTHFPLTGLTDFTAYFIAIAANDTSGNESPLSTELVLTPTDSVVPLAALGTYGSVSENGFLQPESASFSFSRQSDDFRVRYESKEIGVDEVEIWINGVPSGFLRENSSTDWSSWTYIDCPVEVGASSVNSLIFNNINNPPSADSWGVRKVLIPAEPPSFVRGIADNSICYISWNCPDSKEIAGYNVYRYDYATDTTVIANSALLSYTNFVDTYLVNGNQYVYYVVTVMTNGEESELSTSFTGMPVYTGTTPAVYDMTVGKSANDLFMKWTDISYEAPGNRVLDVPSYNVEISNSRDFSNTLTYNTADNQYQLDGILNDGQNYYIRINSSDKKK